MYLIYNQKNIIVDVIDRLHLYCNDRDKGGMIETEISWEGQYILGSSGVYYPVANYNLGNEDAVRAYIWEEEIPTYLVPNEYKLQFNEKPEESTEEFKSVEIVSAFDTNVEHREYLYNTLACISFDDKDITVTKAGELFAYYLAEGKTAKTEELTTLIVEAKDKIREKYPDENE